MIEPLQSTRLALTLFSADDAAESFACMTPSLTRFMTWQPPENREDFDAVWHEWLPAMDAHEGYVFTIRLRSNGSFLGLIALNNVQEEPELGIWIREDQHRQGIAPEALVLVVAWASKVHRIISFRYAVAVDNRPSHRVAELLGGVVVGEERIGEFASMIYRIPGQTDDPLSPCQRDST